MSKKIHGKCRLCLKHTKLIKSHIIPESLYKLVYGDEAHKFITMSTDTSHHIELHQKGLREPLMCRKCDGDVIGQYDTYIASWLFQHAGHAFSQPRTILFKDVDYRLFRLFHLSLLWRFHIAEGQSYDAVDLGSDAETIREMLLDGDPGADNFYPCMMIIPHEIGEALAGGIFCPVATGEDGLPMCRIIAAGFLWVWFMVPNASDHPFLEACVKQDGSMHIIKGPPELTEKIKRELVELNLATYKAPNAHKLNNWGFE